MIDDKGIQSKTLGDQTESEDAIEVLKRKNTIAR